MTSPITWLITGSSRGLGFELVKQLIAVPSNSVIATCRDPAKATALQNLKGGATGTLHIIALDIGDEASIRDSVKTVEDLLSGKGLDYLYNNAGILVQDSAFDFKYADMLRTLETNVAAPALMSQIGGIGNDWCATIRAKHTMYWWCGNKLHDRAMQKFWPFRYAFGRSRLRETAVQTLR